MRKNHGKEEARARDLFYGLWVNDLFMQRVEANGDWSLFCPNEAPGLADVWGEEFDKLFTRCVRSLGVGWVGGGAQEEVGGGQLGWLWWVRKQLQGKQPNTPERGV